MICPSAAWLNAFMLQQGPACGVLGATYSAGLTSTSRLLRSPLLHAQGHVRLAPSPRGAISNLMVVPVPTLLPGQGQVLLSVQAVGLNFRDVLNVLGMYPGDPGEPGGDVSGTVMAVGPGAERLHMCAPPRCLQSTRLSLEAASGLAVAS